MYPHYHTYISTSSNTCIHFIEYVYSHHRTRISLPHFVGIYVYAGTINRPLQLLTVCNNAANKLQYTHVHPRNTILSHYKNHTFAPQKPYFYTTNTILSHRKYPLFAPQKPYFYTSKTILLHHKNHTFTPQKPICDKLGGSQKRFVKIIIVAETNISHTQNKTLSSLLEYHFLNHYNRLYRVRITI